MEEIVIKLWGRPGEQPGPVKHPGTHVARSLCHLRPEETNSFAVPGSGKHCRYGGGAGDQCCGLSEGQWPLLLCSKARREPRRREPKIPKLSLSPLLNFLLESQPGLHPAVARGQGSPSGSLRP